MAVVKVEHLVDVIRSKCGIDINSENKGQTFLKQELFIIIGKLSKLEEEVKQAKLDANIELIVEKVFLKIERNKERGL